MKDVSLAQLLSMVRRSVTFTKKPDTEMSEVGIISQFLQDKNVAAGQCKISAKELYQVFVGWAASKEFKPIPSQRALGLTLRRLLPYKRTNGNRPHYFLNSDLRETKREKKAKIKKTVGPRS